MDSITILFDNEIPIHYSFGIDLLFFHNEKPTSSWRGLKLINPGLHLIHLTDNLSNNRIGRFLKLNKGDVLLFKFKKIESAEESSSIQLDDYNDIFEIEIKDLSFLKNYDDYIFKMVNVNSINPDFIRIWERLDLNNLNFKKFLKNDTGVVSTNDCSSLEIREINKEIFAKDKSDRLYNKWNENELVLTILDFKNKKSLVRQNREGGNRTMDYLDKSWLIQDNWGGMADFNQELKFCFMLMVVLNNYGSYLQWIKLLHIILNCVEIVNKECGFFIEFLTQLKAQLEIINLMDSDNTQQEEVFFIDLRQLGKDFKTFLYNEDQIDNFQVRFLFIEIVNFMNAKFGSDLSESLDDGKSDSGSGSGGDDNYDDDYDDDDGDDDDDHHHHHHHAIESSEPST